MAGPTDLHTTVTEILDASVDALNTIPDSAPALEGAPERSFISSGAPAIECCPGGGQLTVHVDSLSDVPLAAGLDMGKLKAGKKNQVTFVITIARCIDSLSKQSRLRALDMDAQTATAQQTDADVWALWIYLYNLWRSGDLFSLCGEVFFEGARPLGQQGGCSGWSIVIRATLNGYENTPSS